MLFIGRVRDAQAVGCAEGFARDRGDMGMVKRVKGKVGAVFDAAFVVSRYFREQVERSFRLIRTISKVGVICIWVGDFTPLSC